MEELNADWLLLVAVVILIGVIVWVILGVPGLCPVGTHADTFNATFACLRG